MNKKFMNLILKVILDIINNDKNTLNRYKYNK